MRDLSREEEKLACDLFEIWSRTAEGSGSLRICDFGSGLGDLILRTLSHFSSDSFAQMDIELIDRDLALAEHAQALLETKLGVRARSVAPDRFLSAEHVYDLILASHVLYYVECRSSLISCLLNRLAPGGSACFVIRSEDCDTYKIRSAVRAAESRDWGQPLQRVTPRTVANAIEGCGLSPLLREKKLEVSMPIEDSSLDEALSPGPVSLTAEVIRLLAHLPPKRRVSDGIKKSLERELEVRSDGKHLRLTLADTIVAARAH